MRYVALSHQWGKKRPFELNASTYSQLLSGAELDQFPPTFRDAILICRRLVYRYLWIDSLCIFQDSKDDWYRESLLMGNVYQYCDVSIAALGARDNDGGCFTLRNPLEYLPCILSKGHDYQGRDTIVASGQRDYPWHGEDLGTGSLSKRAWVLQERCLPPRTIYFGKYGVFWECRRVRADELYEKNNPQPHCSDHLKLLVTEIGLTSRSSIDSSDLFNFFTNWYELVMRYTSAKLTFGSDKLVAIAGLVELAQFRTGLNSIAGLWEPSFLPHLLWRTFPQFHNRPSEYRAPMFSWASVDSQVDHRYYTGESRPKETVEAFLSTIIDCALSPRDHTRPFAQVEDGYIKIRGPLIQVKIVKILRLRKQ
jgi:hypothetical protein